MLTVQVIVVFLLMLYFTGQISLVSNALIVVVVFVVVFVVLLVVVFIVVVLVVKYL